MKLPAQDSIQDFLTDTSITGWDAILAVVVLLAAWLAARIARRAVHPRHRDNPTATATVEPTRTGLRTIGSRQWS